MKRIVVLWSSPNAEGLTAAAKNQLLSGLREAGAEVEEVQLDALRLERCRACGNGWGTCRSEGSCVIADDFAALYGKLAEAAKAPADAFAGITLMSEHKLTDAFKTTYQYQNYAADLYFSPDGRYAVYSHADGFLEIFKKDDGERVSCVFSEFQTRVNSVAFCGDMLAVSHESGKLMFCDLSRGTVIKVLGTDGYYDQMVFSPSGEQLMGAVSSGDRLDVLSVKDGLMFTMRTGEAINSFAFTEDGSKAVGITSSGYVAGDLFTDEEGVVSWCGVAAVAAWATWRIGAPPMWSVLVFIGAFLVSGAVWYWLFRGGIGQPVRRLMQKNAPDETIDTLKGAKGTLRVVEGKTMFRWNGDELWPVANPPAGAADGQPAEAAGMKDGQVVLKD